jgi:hypothetical protein
MNRISPRWEPQRIPQVEPDLLASAIFLVSEYVAEREAEARAIREEDEEDGTEEETVALDTRVLLDRLAEELGTEPKTTLAVYIRLTALFRLLARAPQLGPIATEPDDGGTPTPAALAAAASLDLYPDPASDAPGDFDPQEFEAALDDA